MGLFDGAKDALWGDQPIVPGERVTPFDRWFGLNDELMEEGKPSESAAYIDPNDPANYFSISLAKPMGIVFSENSESGGTYIDEVLKEGSAARSTKALAQGDQLVGVDSTVVYGASLEVALDTIKNSAGEQTKLTFYRGPTVFLYGPTAPDKDWYQTNLL